MPEASKVSVESPVVATPANSTEVYVVHGAEPEVQAYAMAKYSRSALSMKESLREISRQKAEKFLNTFYFQYGHRSIADLAHIALAVERLSILAAIALVDEQRWDGQERSTRYQDFRKSGYYVPEFGGNQQAVGLYREATDALFADYDAISDHIFRYLVQQTPRPAEMKQDAYERTLRARAFDVSRYLLPLATNTSLGEIVNARTLETQVSRLLSSSYAEIRRLGELLKSAAKQPAYNVNQDIWRGLAEKAHEADPELGNLIEQELLRPVAAAPTLVKYADRSAYIEGSRRDLQAAASEVVSSQPLGPAPAVDLLDDESLEIELAATLLYEHCHHSYRQVRFCVEDLSAARRQEIIDLGVRHRGSHDELLRAYCAGQRLRFDMLMDIGGFRDMHRHRRCVQIGQDFTFAHGYDTPPEITDSGIAGRYNAAMQRSKETGHRIEGLMGKDASSGREDAIYVMPLAYRKRTLFKMDFAEAVYIAELRTTPTGHVSYRNVAYQMYEEIARKHPALAKHIRVHDVRQPIDLLKR